MDNMIRLAGMISESLANGPGLRSVIFAQTCIHNCKGCFNPETHSASGGVLVDVNKVIDDINSNPIISGVTFSGGDPWEQGDKFAYIAKGIKRAARKADFNIWCYTGYTFEYILQNKDKRAGWSELLESIDVLVDGKFIEEKYDKNLKYRGSSNQRIIDVKESLKKGEAVTLEF
ncbi:MAG: anaerobic ribonucleoside-triphosphate reductase activating protein [Clostridiaceae bacterium]